MPKYYIHTTLWSIITLVVSGSMAQTFLLEYGLSEEKVTSYFSIMQLMQIFTILLFSKRSDNLKSIVKTLVKSHLLDIPLCLLFVYLCFVRIENMTTLFVLIIVAGAFLSIATGIHNVLAYKLPYLIIDMEYYGTLLAVSGALIGIFNVLFTVISQQLQMKLGYMTAMQYITIIIVAFLGIFPIATGTMKEKMTTAYNETRERINLLRYKPFLALIIPNIARGFCLGMVTMIITIGYFTNLIDGVSANYIIIITNVMQITASFSFSKISMIVPEKYVLLFSSIIVAIMMPLLTIGNTTMFLVVYSILYFVIIILNNAVPLTVTKIIDYKVAGQYSAGRMLLNTLGTSLAGFLCIPMFKMIGVVPTLAIAGGMQMVSGVGYYWVMRRIEKKF